MHLSVVILSFNVRDLLKKTLQSVYGTYKEQNFQVIVVDNASSDGSAAMVKKDFPQVDLVESKTNTGYAAGNNLARPLIKGNVVLFLNSDVVVKGNAIGKCLQILNRDKSLGAVTCKVLLPNGKLDYSCHRGLPTPWNSFCYFSGLSKLFPRSEFFSGYTASYLNTETGHKIDCVTGAFLMIKKPVLEKIGWWDEDYWWNGEDIELCYRIKKSGFGIWYEPSEKIIHYKGSSSGLYDTAAVKVSRETKLKSAISAARVMRIFTRKHRSELGPAPLMYLVGAGICLLEKFRLLKIKLGLKYG